MLVYMGNSLRCHTHNTQHLIPNFQTLYCEQPGVTPGSERAALGRSTLLLPTLLDKDLHPLFVTIFPMHIKMLKLTSTYVSVATINRPVLNLLNSAPHHSPSTLCVKFLSSHRAHRVGYISKCPLPPCREFPNLHRSSQKRASSMRITAKSSLASLISLVPAGSFSLSLSLSLQFDNSKTQFVSVST